ncbi:DUF3263 domain-containing protein [Pseudoclavibacter sp. VKM Ac-2888]|uniref:DUF3263 domain-containing protein n=1 Tax=Pseudoclavibacter sp. VKM Ac-2888 TaxID=2783830 RepID=UPI00188A5D24|nr:DUF3263 domain-containing protein [Pseudoclavibacter sp. VKM Ac-2888]MBF4549653.1 DUF3263 domain-containing protein [Pseudoclavibacter sp. VKM Ac-2888]
MLTDTERRVLEFEAANLRHTAHKQAGIRALDLGLTPTSYYRALAVVLAKPEAIAEFPRLAAWHKRAADARAGTKERRRIERMESASQRVRNELAS